MSPEVSVIVPVGTADHNFQQCLRSLAETSPPPREIIIVADGLPQSNWPLVANLDAQVLRTPTKIGPAKARNLGARTGHSAILFFVDSDVAVPPDAIAQVAAALDSQPGVAAVFGSYDDEPPVANFLSQYKNLFHHFVHQTSREEASTFWAGCGAIQREVFWRVGGFSERFTSPSIEDIELGYRLKKAGYRVRLLKTLQVKHLKRWDFISLLVSDFFQRALPWSKLVIRDRSLFIDDLNLRLTSRASVILAYGLIAGLLGGAFWPLLLGLAPVSAIGLLLLNLPLFRFFMQKRGLVFALSSLPWQWLYYFYSGLAFGLAAAGHLLHILRQPLRCAGTDWQNIAGTKK